ncbi:RNA polymerase sigma factor [Subtercola boreus]|uniref:RNA polymerase sigma factor n=1 Tax=Subtercola boreus TaxID=120213 RepID=UPI00209BEEDC|nr:sigma-70 family RNA polymerase sigma factor [Subtercola boreus]
MSTDSDIILRSRASPALFGQLYERHARTIHRYAARRAGENVADDIMSETFLVAFDRRERFDPAWADARPWLFGIATTLLKAHRRVEARTWNALIAAGLNEISTASASEQPADRSNALMDAQLAVRSLAPALQAMRDDDRDALLLYAWADLDYAGVAVAMGIPVGTVRSRLNRARRILQAAAATEPPHPTPRTGSTSWTS